jgi:INO80 complex subunit C
MTQAGIKGGNATTRRDAKNNIRATRQSTREEVEHESEFESDFEHVIQESDTKPDSPQSEKSSPRGTLSPSPEEHQFKKSKLVVLKFKVPSSLPIMAPTPSESNGEDSHQKLLDSLDVMQQHRPFRSSNWKPSQRRNKNVKQIIGEAVRREASTIATQNNSGTTTPALQGTNGSATPAGPGSNTNIAQAAQSLSTLVLEKNLQAKMAAAGGAPEAAGGAVQTGGPVVTYTNIESAPSLHPAHQKPYCDITGLPAPYRDPKTRLRYYNGEVFQMIRTLPQGVAEQYLAARQAHVILK